MMMVMHILAIISLYRLPLWSGDWGGALISPSSPKHLYLQTLAAMMKMQASSFVLGHRRIPPYWQFYWIQPLNCCGTLYYGFFTSESERGDSEHKHRFCTLPWVIPFKAKIPPWWTTQSSMNRLGAFLRIAFLCRRGNQWDTRVSQ